MTVGARFPLPFPSPACPPYYPSLPSPPLPYLPSFPCPSLRCLPPLLSFLLPFPVPFKSSQGSGGAQKLTHFTVSKTYITKFPWGRLGDIAATTFWPWGRSLPSPPWSRRLWCLIYIRHVESCVIHQRREIVTLAQITTVRSYPKFGELDANADLLPKKFCRNFLYNLFTVWRHLRTQPWRGKVVVMWRRFFCLKTFFATRFYCLFLFNSKTAFINLFQCFNNKIHREICQYDIVQN